MVRARRRARAWGSGTGRRGGAVRGGLGGSAWRWLGRGLLVALVQELAHLGQAGAGGLQIRVQGQGALEALERLLR